MRSKFAGASLLLAIAMVLPYAPARAEINIHVDIGNAPPPPRIVFQREPHVVYVQESRVYVVDEDNCDYDTFRYGNSWYIWNAGFWYRSRSYRGPFVVIQEAAVPVAIYRVPPVRWRHHPHGGPPGLARRDRRIEAARDRRDVIVIKEKRHSEHEHKHGDK